MTTSANPVAFQNIQVWVKPKPDEPGRYDVRSEPLAPQIIDADTVINYEIVDTDGYPIVFTGMSVHPVDNNQLSTASISLDGRLLTFSDINTVKIMLNITLHFKDNTEGQAFSHDPQIANDPQK